MESNEIKQLREFADAAKKTMETILAQMFQ